jgi:hypothetical protein
VSAASVQAASNVAKKTGPTRGTEPKGGHFEIVIVMDRVPSWDVSGCTPRFLWKTFAALHDGHDRLLASRTIE